MLWIEFSSVVVETCADCGPAPLEPPMPDSEAIEYMDMRFAMLSAVGCGAPEGTRPRAGFVQVATTKCLPDSPDCGDVNNPISNRYSAQTRADAVQQPRWCRLADSDAQASVVGQCLRTWCGFFCLGMRVGRGGNGEGTLSPPVPLSRAGRPQMGFGSQAQPRKSGRRGKRKATTGEEEKKPSERVTTVVDSGSEGSNGQNESKIEKCPRPTGTNERCRSLHRTSGGRRGSAQKRSVTTVRVGLRWAGQASCAATPSMLTAGISGGPGCA